MVLHASLKKSIGPNGRHQRPAASSPGARSRMMANRRRDTAVELRLRSLLHGMGLRYVVDSRPVKNLPRRADVVFRRAKVAIFVDGCFWHGCPRHGTWPKANKAFWHAKILRNRLRDSDTNMQLQALGWQVIRIWEHEDLDAAAHRIQASVDSRQPPRRTKSGRAS